MEGFYDKGKRPFSNMSSQFWRANVNRTDNYMYKFKQQQIKRDCMYNIPSKAINSDYYRSEVKPLFENVPQIENSAEKYGAWFTLPQNKPRTVVSGFPLAISSPVVTKSNYCGTPAGVSKGSLLKPSNYYAMSAGNYKQQKFWVM